MILAFFLIRSLREGKIIAEDHLFQKKINEFVYDGFEFRLGRTGSEIMRFLGDPVKISKKEINNIHDPDQVDLVNELFYDGLSIRIYRVAETGKEIIINISITGDEYNLKWGLGVGSPQDDIKAQLGDPHEEEKDAYIYQAEGAPSCVVFYFRNSRVYRIDWEFYYD